MRFVFRVVSELGRGIEIGFECKNGSGADRSDPVEADWAMPRWSGRKLPRSMRSPETASS
jgi:hypothetical protein